MDKSDLDAIAQRPTCCKTFGESVTISRAERDALVAMALDGVRYRWLRQDRDVRPGLPFIAIQSTALSFSRWIDASADEAIDAAMAKEQA